MTNEEFELAWNKFIQSIQLASVDQRSEQQKLDEQYVHIIKLSNYLSSWHCCHVYCDQYLIIYK